MPETRLVLGEWRTSQIQLPPVSQGRRTITQASQAACRQEGWEQVPWSWAQGSFWVSVPHFYVGQNPRPSSAGQEL